MNQRNIDNFQFESENIVEIYYYKSSQRLVFDCNSRNLDILLSSAMFKYIVIYFKTFFEINNLYFHNN